MKAVITTDSGEVVKTVDLFDDKDFMDVFSRGGLSSLNFMREKRSFESDAQEAFHSAAIVVITQAAEELMKRGPKK